MEEDAAKLANERTRIGLALLYGALGDRKAYDQVRLALEVNPADPWTLFWASEVYGLLGDDEKALASLQQAADRGFLSIFYLDLQREHSSRGLYHLRNHPRLLAIRTQLANRIDHLRRVY